MSFQAKSNADGSSGLRISGEMEFRNVMTNLPSTPFSSCTFEVTTVGEKWQMRILYASTGQEIIYGGDGTNLFWVFKDDQAVKQHGVTSYAGNVFHGTYPVQSSTIFTSLPWLAYCSRTFFSTNTQNGQAHMPAPWLSAYSDPVSQVYAVKYIASNQSNALPSFLSFTPSAEKIDVLIANGYKIDGNELPVSERDKLAIKLESYYRKITEPEATFEVLKWTSKAGFIVPQEFQFTGYVFAQNKSGEFKREVGGKTTGRALDIEEISAVDPMPKITDGTLDVISVADYRFANNSNKLGFLSYPITNSIWLPMDDPFLLALLDKENSAISRQYRSKVIPSNIAFVVFLSVVSLLILVAVTIRRKLG